MPWASKRLVSNLPTVFRIGSIRKLADHHIIEEKHWRWCLHYVAERPKLSDPAHGTR